LRYSNIEYTDMMTFKGGGPMLCELFGPLVGLEAEWAAQGASTDEISLAAFGFDYVLFADAGAACGFIGGTPEETIEESERFLITRDRMGRTMKLAKDVATIALPLDYPVKDADDWLKMKAHFAYDDCRVDVDSALRAAAMRKGGALSRVSVPGAFGAARDLMGDEAVCMALYDQPDLLRDMFVTFAKTSVEVIKKVGRIVPIDNVCIGEDLAGKSGPLVSPEHVREFFAPYYKEVWDAAREAGAKLFSQDSDGNVEPVMEAFIECGVNVFFPCEPAAGMDVVKLRKRFGKRCAFKGGIDKMALRGSFADIERELTYKLGEPSLREGMVFGLDHRIPNGVPIVNYRHYVKRARQLLGMPEAAPQGHVRMAF